MLNGFFHVGRAPCTTEYATRNSNRAHCAAAWSIELGYTTEIFGAKTYGALAYSRTAELAGTFPEARTIASLGTWFSNNIRLALDYVYDEDYPRRVNPLQLQGSTGKTADSFILRLTYEW